MDPLVLVIAAALIVLVVGGVVATIAPISSFRPSRRR